jgi:F-type H+-transporting ATPase subunit b
MTIDWWTLLFQTVNVVVLVWLLERFFWRPVASIIAQRQTTARQTLADARAQVAKAADAVKEIAATRAGFAEERETLLAAARTDAKKASAALHDQAAEDAAGLRAAAKAGIETDARAADKAWADRSSLLGIDIAGRLAARLAGPAVNAAFLDWLLKAVRELPEPARRAVAEPNAALEVISATPLDAAEQKHASDLIHEAFGARPRIAYTTDPGLIAGLELRAPHLLVSNSWRADLTDIQTDLAHDHRR